MQGKSTDAQDRKDLKDLYQIDPQLSPACSRLGLLHFVPHQYYYRYPGSSLLPITTSEQDDLFNNERVTRTYGVGVAIADTRCRRRPLAAARHWHPADTRPPSSREHAAAHAHATQGRTAVASPCGWAWC